MSLVLAFTVGAALLTCGVFAAVWHGDLQRALVALPTVAAGVAIAFAAASRFAAGRQDPATGQEMAALVTVAALAAVVLATAFAARDSSRTPPARRSRGDRR